MPASTTTKYILIDSKVLSIVIMFIFSYVFEGHEHATNHEKKKGS